MLQQFDKYFYIPRVVVVHRFDGIAWVWFIKNFCRYIFRTSLKLLRTLNMKRSTRKIQISVKNENKAQDLKNRQSQRGTLENLTDMFRRSLDYFKFDKLGRKKRNIQQSDLQNRIRFVYSFLGNWDWTGILSHQICNLIIQYCQLIWYLFTLGTQNIVFLACLGRNNKNKQITFNRGDFTKCTKMFL